MNGTDANTGKPISGIARLRQSIRDILTTRRGSRIMRREYGSDLFKWIDAPLNRRTLLAIYAATVAALARWEPEFRVSKVQATSASPGSITLDVTGEYLPGGNVMTLEGIEVS